MKVESVVTHDTKDDRQVLATVLSDVRELGDRDSRILIWVYSECMSGRTHRTHRDKWHNLAGV